jgi:hypothetical protein
MSKVFAIAALIGGSAVLTMVGAGCSSDNTADHPYGLTGNTPNYTTTTAQRLAWTDEKGHYRSDWEAGINRPPQYPKAVSVE